MTKARNGLQGLIITGFFLATGSLLFWPASAGAQTTGLMVGSPSNPLPINAGTQNLFYGVVTATSTLGNFVLLEKGPGTPIFRIGVDGSIYTTGDLVGGNTVWSVSGNNIFNANTGNVGIGTTVPAARLDVNAATGNEFTVYDGFYQYNIGGDVRSNGGPNTNYLSIWKDGSKTYFNTVGGDAGYRFRVSGNDMVSINSVGNLGIGTTAPQTKFHVAGDYVSIDGLGLITSFTPTGGYARFAWWNPASPDTKFAFGSGFSDASRFGIHIKTSGNFTAATERFTILNNGNIGIGTTNPTQLLEVAGAAKFNNVSFGVTPTSGQTTALATVEYANSVGLPSGTSGQTLRHTGSAWQPNSVLYNNGTNVGIGTTGPGEKLQVAGAIRATGALTTWTANSSSISQETNGLYLSAAGPDTSTRGQISLYIARSNGTSGIIALRVDNNGNLGIGVTDLSSGGANAKLGVAGGHINLDDDYSIAWGGGSGRAYIQGNKASNFIALGVNGAERIRINSSGNVGIGTSTTLRRLQIEGGYPGFVTNSQGNYVHDFADSLYTLRNKGGARGLEFRANINSSFGGRISGIAGGLLFSGNGGAANHLSILTDGNVGIGTTNPTMKLEVAGAAKFNNVSFGVTPTSGQTTALATVEYVNGILPPGSLGQTLRHNGSGWVADSNLYNNGTNVGMGLATTPATRLDIRDANNDTAVWSRNGTIILRNTNATANTWQGIQSQGTGSINAGIAFVNMDQANSYGRIDFGVRGASGWFGAAMSVNNGNVGVGTTTPAQKLDVVGYVQSSDSGGNFVNFSSGQDNAYPRGRFYIGSRTGDSFTNAALVVAPNVTTGVQRTTFLEVRTNPVNSVSAYRFMWRQSTSLAEFISSTNDGNGVGSPMLFTTRGGNYTVPAIYISNDSSQNVGIGLTNPTQVLEVAGAAKFNNVSFGVTPTSGQTTALATVEYVTGAVSGAAGPWTRSGSSTYLANNNDNTGVGTTNPGAKLHVSAASTAPGNRGQFVVGTGMGTGSGNLDLGFNSTSGYAWLQSGVDGISFNNLILNSSGGNVGIGTVSPANAKLEVNGSINVQSLGDSYRFNGRTDLGLFGNGNYSLALQSPNDITVNIDSNNNDTTAVFRINTNTTGITGGTNLLTLMENGNLGLGLTNPSQRLEVAGAAKFNNISYGVTPPSALITALATVEYVNNYVGGATTSSIYLPKTGGTMIGDINMGGNHLTNVGELSVSKLYATVIDPLYHLKGTNYSTFAASIVGGLKEEYVGQARVDKKNARLGEYEHVIDFAAAPEGSDLWVWRQVVDFSSQNVEVLATPSGHFAQLYYIIEGEKVILRSDRPADISYRLIGKRLDWRQWPTKAIDQSVRGVTLTP